MGLVGDWGLVCCGLDFLDVGRWVILLTHTTQMFWVVWLDFHWGWVWYWENTWITKLHVCFFAIFMLWLISAVPCDSRSSSTTCCFFMCAADIACGSRTCYSSPAHQLFSVCFQSSSFSDLSPACTPAPHYSSAPAQIRPKPSCCSGHVSCLYYCAPFRFLSDGKFVFHSLVIDEGAKCKTDV